MLLIENGTETAWEVSYRLAGKFTEGHLGELEQLLDLDENSGRRIVLDLFEIVLVDRYGVRLLAFRESRGVELVHCPAYVLLWIKSERENGGS